MPGRRSIHTANARASFSIRHSCSPRMIVRAPEH